MIAILVITVMVSFAVVLWGVSSPGLANERRRAGPLAVTLGVLAVTVVIAACLAAFLGMFLFLLR